MTTRYGTPVISAFVIRRFPREDLRRTQFEFEDAFSKFINGKTRATPLPDNAPPDLPRFLMGDGKRTLTVSENAAQLHLNFESSVPTGGILPAIANAVKHFSAAEAILSSQNVYYSAIIIEIDVPVTDLERVDFLNNSICNAIGLGNPSGINISWGFLQEWGNSNIELMLTKSVQSSIPNSVGATFFYDVDFLEDASDGIKVKFDINTKPFRWSPRQNDLNILSSNIESTTKELHSAFLTPEFSNLFARKLFP